VDERVATYVPLTQIQQRLSTLHANSTPTGVLGIAAKRERTQTDDPIFAAFAVVVCVGIQPKNVCTQTCCLTGVSYFIVLPN